MALPKIIQKLFSDAGKGTKLNSEIIPPLKDKTSEELFTFIGEKGELTYNTTEKRIVVHDGVTAGGHALATDADLATVRSEAQTAQTTANAAQASAIAAQSTADACLPLSGGKITGMVRYSTLFPVVADADDMRIHVCGGSNWDKGAHLVLTGKDENGHGAFELVCQNGDVRIQLQGKPDGSLIWGDNEVERVNSKSETDSYVWIRYESGLQICVMDAIYTANADYVNVPLPVAFKGEYWAVITNYSHLPMAAVWTYLIVNSQTLKLSVFHSSNHTDYLTYDTAPTIVCVGFWK